MGYHIILTGYGHWLPNDPRGNLSTKLRSAKLAAFGDIHHGRTARQPSRTELAAFQRRAREKLRYDVLWFDAAKWQAIAKAFGQAVKERRYTCWACAILSNHAHLVIRKHRDKGEMMIEKLQEASANWLRRLAIVPPDHPIWSSDPYKKYLDTPEDAERTIHYVEQNPIKAGLAQQVYEFVRPYRGEWRTQKNR